MKSMVSAIVRDPFYFSTLFYFSFTYWQNSYFSVDDFAISPPYLRPFMRRVSRIHCFRRMTIYNMPVIPMTSSQSQKYSTYWNVLSLVDLMLQKPACAACHLIGLASAWCKVASLAFIFLRTSLLGKEKQQCVQAWWQHTTLLLLKEKK